MRGKRGNNLIVIENGQLHTYLLDDKLEWSVGRPSKENHPDIKLYSNTVSRHHGIFSNTDGIWFYQDQNGKNGTMYNGKHIKTGYNGRVRSILVSDGDVFIFGGAQEEAVINSKTVWAMFSTNYFEERWRVSDTKDRTDIILSDGEKLVRLERPSKGTVVEKDDGIAIYMGDITYLVGNMSLVTSE